MRYGVTFTLLGFCWLLLAVTYHGLAWLLLWPAVSFLAVGAAYLGAGPCVFGKRPNGSMSPVHLLVLLPYVALAWVVWALMSVMSKEAPAHEVAPGIWIGRRLGKSELPTRVQLIVDLTCELWEPRAVRAACPYVSCPTLDTGVPDLQTHVEKLRFASGAILIHCAQGHGRSALLAASVMVDLGMATNPDDALRRIVAVRPGVRLSPDQHRALTAKTPAHERQR